MVPTFVMALTVMGKRAAYLATVSDKLLTSSY